MNVDLEVSVMQQFHVGWKVSRMKNILCEKCKIVIGLIEEDALVMDGEFGNIGIMKMCKNCKKETYEYKNNLDRNELIENPEGDKE